MEPMHSPVPPLVVPLDARLSAALEHLLADAHHDDAGPHHDSLVVDLARAALPHPLPDSVDTAALDAFVAALRNNAAALLKDAARARLALAARGAAFEAEHAALVDDNEARAAEIIERHKQAVAERVRTALTRNDGPAAGDALAVLTDRVEASLRRSLHEAKREFAAAVEDATAAFKRDQGPMLVKLNAIMASLFRGGLTRAILLPLVIISVVLHTSRLTSAILAFLATEFESIRGAPELSCAIIRNAGVYRKLLRIVAANRPELRLPTTADYTADAPRGRDPGAIFDNRVVVGAPPRSPHHPAPLTLSALGSPSPGVARPQTRVPRAATANHSPPRKVRRGKVPFASPLPPERYRDTIPQSSQASRRPRHHGFCETCRVRHPPGRHVDHPPVPVAQPVPQSKPRSRRSRRSASPDTSRRRRRSRRSSPATAKRLLQQHVQELAASGAPPSEYALSLRHAHDPDAVLTPASRARIRARLKLGDASASGSDSDELLHLPRPQFSAASPSRAPRTAATASKLARLDALFARFTSLDATLLLPDGPPRLTTSLDALSASCNSLASSSDDYVYADDAYSVASSTDVVINPASVANVANVDGQGMLSEAFAQVERLTVGAAPTPLLSAADRPLSGLDAASRDDDLYRASLLATNDAIVSSLVVGDPQFVHGSALADESMITALPHDTF
ncbi:uncharacterized protein AMSG_08505 [Thecamonas trahens ATCC 50062]|uniref:Uncharacterized protein n=1 Tax=Thecamonas trahens ATCC 50062 TaxID=461836 RepID=A0A0L0DK22_THETB|nr:hypothetical protein AMSG_08505 [Thecamonas trahens ATCC 50062]KNC52637.1 hypothetical protein AMSG_08505 [Thecamonas trahens ATCC 50062]|eukprot:XP_013755189.1 hypothetical protein AMSG_08505 [Thecamonas trahens ATCC 50062]